MSAKHPAEALTLHVQASTLEALFVEAACRMVALAGAEVKPGIALRRTMDVRGEDHASLMLAWLRELLMYMDNEDRVFTDFTVELLTPGRLLAEARGGLKQTIARRLSLPLGLEVAVRHGPAGFEVSLPFTGRSQE